MRPPGRSAPRRTRTRPCPRSSARRRWPSTAAPSTSDRPTRRRRTSAMAVTRGDAATSPAAGPLAASVGLTDADLVEMYRLVALARAIDERMWILNRAGRIPFVISGQGHEGAQVGIAWAFQRGHDWI